jgi:lambda family phage portal protein
MLTETKRTGRFAIPPPNIIDRIVSYVSPVAGAHRARARAFTALLGSYNGASRSRRSLKEWNPTNGDADSDILWDLPYLRERSRDLIRNAPIATGAIGTSIANVVGTGLKLQSRIDAEYLGMTDDEADAWEDNTEREWRLFSESKECDISRTLNFVGLQALAFRQVLENGDVFALLPRKERRRVPYSLKIQLIEADRCCNKDYAPDSETLIAGAEKEAETGAPTAYHFMNQHPGQVRVQKSNAYTWKVVQAFGSNTGLRNVLHLYEMLRPGQTRGVPFLAPVMEALKQVSSLSENELMASTVASLFTVFIESDDGEIDFDLSSDGMAPETGAKASDPDIKMANGNIIGLRKNEKISTAAPGRPNAAFEPFFMAIVTQIGAALGIPKEVLMRAFNSSYSASRASLLEAWRFFRGRRVWLVDNFCQPIYDVWLYEAIASGRISAPGFFAEPMIAKAYSGSIWAGDAPGFIDPAKDIDAAIARINSRISTLDEETTLITGGDFEKNVRQAAKEKRMLDKAELSAAPAPAGPGRPPLTPEEKARQQKEEDGEI